MRGRAHQDLPGLGALLEPSRDVQRLAGGERRVAVLDHDLACLDPDPHRQVGVSGLDDRDRGPDRALGVVLVRRRDAEHGDDGVARILLHGSAERLDVAAGAVEEARDPPPDDLRVGRRDERGRVDEVDEQRRRELALHAPSLGSGAAAAEAVTALPLQRRRPARHNCNCRR